MLELLNDNLSLQAPKQLDDRRGPHATLAAALAFITPARRVSGLDFLVISGSAVLQYWWPTTSLGDGDVVLISWQPLDGDLTAIANLSDGSVGYLKKTAANTWILDNKKFVPYTGADEDVDLNNHVITVNSVNTIAVDNTPFLKSNDVDFINIPELDTFKLRGTTNNSKGYIRFGGAPYAFGYDGSNLVYGSMSVNASGHLTANKYIVSGGTSAQFLKADGSLDGNTYLTTISGIAAGGELAGTYANPTLVNSAVTGKILSGVNITGGTIVDTDSILTAFGKVQNQINSLVGGMQFVDLWNASTNSPAIPSAIGNKGKYYIVQVAGSTNLSGITDWQVGDWAVSNGVVWSKIDNTDAVVSVNGQTGAVSLTTSHITEGSNLYYTDARVLSYGNTQWVRSVSGTVGKIFSSGGLNPTLTIDAAYVGQSSITNVGTITIGTWNGTAIADSYISSAAVWNAKQVAYANLTAIGSLANANGFLRQNGSGVFSYDTNTYITGNQTITLSGDVSGTGATAITTTIGAGKVTNAMLAGSIDYAKMNAATVPTWNQNTTGTAQYATYWGGFAANFNVAASTMDYLLVRESGAGIMKVGSAALVASFLSGQTMNIVGNASTATNVAASGVTGGHALGLVDDTNVTLSQTNSGVPALLTAKTITVGWIGTLADSRIASSSNWNAAYGWGNHAGLYLSLSGGTVNGRTLFTKTGQTAYTNAALEVYTSDGGETGISFHRGGSSAGFLSHGSYGGLQWNGDQLILNSHTSVTPTASSVVRRDGSGYVEGVYFKATNTGSLATGLTTLTGKYNTGDNYLYQFTDVAVRAWLGIPSGGETLASVTGRGNSTSTAVYFNGGAYASNFGVGEMSFTSNQIYRASANEMYVNFSGTGQTIIGNAAGITLNGATTVSNTLRFLHYLYGTNGWEIFNTTDSYLRLNQAGHYTSGVYTPYNLRADGTTYFGGTAYYINGSNAVLPAITGASLWSYGGVTSNDYLQSNGQIYIRYNNSYLYGRNAADNSWYKTIGINTSNQVVVGDGLPVFVGGSITSGYVYPTAIVNPNTVGYDNGFGLFFGTISEGDNYVIRRRAGSWGPPYYQPLDIKFYTGIRIGADYNYGGTIFYSSSNLASAIFSVGSYDTNIRMHLGGQKLITYNPVSGIEVEAIQSNYFGYSTSYAVLQIGDTRSNRSIAFGVDLTGNTSGSFNGGGLEYVWKNVGKFITPNASNNGYNGLFSWNSSGYITLMNHLSTGGYNIDAGAGAIYANTVISSLFQPNYQNSINTTTPGTQTYGLHFQGLTTADYANGITWNGGSSGAQAGIYVQGSGAYGTKMYLATTDNYTTGSKTALSIDHSGNIVITRGSLSGSAASFTGTIVAGSVGQNIRLTGDGGSGNDGFVGATSNGTLYFRNWSGSRGFSISNTNVFSHSGAAVFGWEVQAPYFRGTGSYEILLNSSTNVNLLHHDASNMYVAGNIYVAGNGYNTGDLLATRPWVSAAYLPLSGGTMSGNIAMSAYSITGATAFYTTGAILNSNQVYTPSGSFHVNYSGTGQTHIGNSSGGVFMYNTLDMNSYNINNIFGLYAGTIYSNTYRNTVGEAILSNSSNITYIGGGAAAHSLAFYAGGANRMQLSTAGSLVQGNTVYPNAKWGASSGTGPVVIKIPGGTGNYGMIHMTIAVYEYNSNAACTITIGGHNWSGGWYNAGVNVIGYTDKSVRLGFKDGQYCVVLGDASSTWSYGQVVVMRVQNGEYYSGSIDLGGTWSVALESDSYTTISGDYRYLRTPKGMSLMDGVMRLGVDATYGTTYNAIGFGGSNTTNADNKIFAAANNLAGLFINAATGQNVYLRSGGSEIGYGNTSNWHFPQTADAGSSTSGALTTAGGFSAAKNIYAGAGIYAGSWFYNSGGTGIYNSSYGGYFYNESASYWTLTSNYGLIIRTGYNSTVKGYLYYDSTGFGLLNQSGQWAVRTNTSSDNQLHGIWAVNMTPSTSYTFEIGGTLGTTGTITAGGKITGTAGGQDSDERLKDFHDFDALSIANTVRLRNYTWKDASKGTEHRYGYSAQAIQQVLPEAVYQVSRNGQTTLAVEYEMVHSVIIDEHTRRIQELEKRVKELEHELGK